MTYLLVNSADVTSVLSGSLFIFQSNLLVDNITYNTRRHFIDQPVHESDVVQILNSCSSSHMKVMPWDDMDVDDDEYESEDIKITGKNNKVLRAEWRDRNIEIHTYNECMHPLINRTIKARTFRFPGIDGIHYSTCSELGLHTRTFVIAMSISACLAAVVLCLCCTCCCLFWYKFYKV